jgi:NAD(P)H-nitrite reductase large subunit
MLESNPELIYKVGTGCGKCKENIENIASKEIHGQANKASYSSRSYQILQEA